MEKSGVWADQVRRVALAHGAKAIHVLQTRAESEDERLSAIGQITDDLARYALPDADPFAIRFRPPHEA